MSMIYFAHPMSDYGSKWEAKAIEHIYQYFHDKVDDVSPYVFNPAMPWLRQGWNMYSMDFWDDHLMPMMDIIVYAPFPNGEVGSGVGREVNTSLKEGLPVYRLDREEFKFTQMRVPIIACLNREDTVKLLKKYGQR